MNNAVAIPRAICAIAQACLEDFYNLRDVAMDSESDDAETKHAIDTLTGLLGKDANIIDDALFAHAAVGAAFAPITVSAVSLDTTEGSVVLSTKNRRIVQVTAAGALGLYLPEGMRFFVTPDDFSAIGGAIRHAFAKARDEALDAALPDGDEE